MGEQESKRPIRETEILIEKERVAIEEILGREWQVVPIGQEGFICVNQSLGLNEKKAHILWDFDDTIGATTVTKSERDKQVKEEFGIPEGIFRTADRYSRVDPWRLGESYYDANLHALLIVRWLSEPGRRPQSGKELGAFFGQIIEQEDLLKRNYQFPPDKVSRQLQQKMLYQVKPYEGMGEAMRQFKEDMPEVDSGATMETFGLPSFSPNLTKPLGLLEGGFKVNTGIFTFGLPVLQAETVKNSGILAQGLINEIWLTRSSKGLFLDTLLRNNPFSRLREGMVKDNQGKPSLPWHVGLESTPILLFDDDPAQVESLLAFQEEVLLKDPLGGAMLVASNASRVREKRQKRAEEELKTSALEMEITNPKELKVAYRTCFYLMMTEAIRAYSRKVAALEPAPPPRGLAVNDYRNWRETLGNVKSFVGQECSRLMEKLEGVLKSEEAQGKINYNLVRFAGKS